ncbi:AAA family ATPase [Shewanella mangrovi]|uniref:AAA family ATPase n=1 Tax=Shewanella mangrovi TaxID=1515746 RepID=UPI00069042F7|nr:AAA family ATPase [Shewanella mangrovi]
MERAFIEKVRFKDVACFEYIDIKLNKEFNFISGKNASGKSFVLSFIYNCFSHENFDLIKFNPTSEAWVDLNYEGRNLRVGVGSAMFNLNGQQKGGFKRLCAPAKSEDRHSLSIYDACATLSDFCPLFISAFRDLDFRQNTRVKHTLASSSQFNKGKFGWGSGSPIEKCKGIKEWFASRATMPRTQRDSNEYYNWQQVVKSLRHVVPEDAELEFVRMEDKEPIFSCYGRNVKVEQLSLGFGAALLIVVSVVLWIESTALVKCQRLDVASGIVLIDEFEMHLHPESQLALRDGLSRLFPNLQFIVSTYSTTLLQNAPAEQVINITPQFDK